MGVPQVPPFDAGNSILGETAALMSTTLIDTPAGQRLALTFRTSSTTLTLLLDGKDAKAWAAQLTRDAAVMSSSGLVAANGHAAVPQ